MTKTLLLCFIHGFKSNDETFCGFPQDLQASLGRAYPALNIEIAIYPTYETRGGLNDCVVRVREWLTNKVIDLEMVNETRSPTIEPSVHTILIGHSMGGIVAAEVLLAIAREESIMEGTDVRQHTQDGLSAPMFPYVKGVLAFDTPYLGISPGVVAHGAEDHWKTGMSAYEAFQSATGFWAGKSAQSAAGESAGLVTGGSIPSATAANAASVEAVTTSTSQASSKGWGKWGTYAMLAGAAGAITAGSAAAYFKRNDLAQGWSWVGSHLEFVGCLARGEELKERVNAVVQLKDERGLGFANFYTCLGRNAARESSMSLQNFGDERTFCNLPRSDLKTYFHKAVNDAATTEVAAHMCMFAPKENPGYYTMHDQTRHLIANWLDSSWLEEPTWD